MRERKTKDPREYLKKTVTRKTHSGIHETLNHLLTFFSEKLRG